MRTGRSSLGWVGWMSVRLWLFFVLLWGSTGCGGDSSVLVTVLRADSETAWVAINLMRSPLTRRPSTTRTNITTPT